jgi:sugar (pentulose or hexulose) kinase
MERYSIGLDLGTSSVKGVLFSSERGILAKDTANFTYAPTSLPDGSEYLGINMENFYRTICSCLSKLGAKLPNGASLEGIAMASASGNSVLCDAEGNAMIDAYSWLTPAMSEDIATVFGRDFGPKVRASAGWGLAPSFPLGQLAHLRVHAPELLDGAAVVCMATEYVLHRLTGKWGMDVSTATPFYMLDQVNRCWNKEYLSKLGIPESKLPPLCESRAFLGEMTATGAADSGLPVGTRVYLGSFDHPTAARACGVEREGDLLISCGTSWVCFFPVNDRERIMHYGMSCDPFLTPNGPWGCICSLARASERVVEVIDKYITSGDDKFEVFEQLASRAPRGAEGLAFNVMEGCPDLSGYSKENIARALMEGVAKALHTRMGDIVKIERVMMCGGPSTNKMWQKVLSEEFEVPLTVTYGPHSGAVGAAMYSL